MTETTQTEQPFSHFIEKSNETQASIIEQNLLSFMERHDTLTERTGLIEHILQLFNAHLRRAQQPQKGYECILEDIRANPDLAERSEQLLQMEQLIAAINSGKLKPETLEHIEANLDQRKQRDLAARIGIIMQRIIDLTNFSIINTDLLAQIKTAFEKDLEKLRHYRDDATVSKWVLESPLLAASAAATSLPIIADVVRDYIELTKTIKAEEAAYLRANIALLSENHDQLTAILQKARAFEETPERNEMIQVLEKDIADVSGFIQRDNDRLLNLIK